MAVYVLVFATGVFFSAVSQVLLKKAALKKYENRFREYMNVYVILGYGILFLTTFFSIFAYKKLPLSMGPIIQVTSYIYVTVFGKLIFGETIGRRKIVAFIVIFAGIMIFVFSD